MCGQIAKDIGYQAKGQEAGETLPLHPVSTVIGAAKPFVVSHAAPIRALRISEQEGIFHYAEHVIRQG